MSDIRKVKEIIVTITDVEGMDFYDNGSPKSFQSFKELNGKLEPVKLVFWDENGQKREEEVYENGKRIRKLNGTKTDR